MSEGDIQQRLAMCQTVMRKYDGKERTRGGVFILPTCIEENMASSFNLGRLELHLLKEKHSHYTL